MTTYTQDQLSEAFDAVRDQDDWRAPICVEVQGDEVIIVIEAIKHFTGTISDVTQLRDGIVEVRSVGYRMGPCGP